MNLMWLQLKLARAQMSVFVLLVILQRTPVIKYALQFEKAATAPITKAIQAITITAASLGSLHAQSGATQFNIVPASPANATVGEEFSLAFAITGTPENAASWQITGTIPPGLSVPSLDGDTLNSRTGTITGTPTQAGTFDVTVQPFDRQNLGGDTTGGETIRILVADIPPEVLRDPQPSVVATGSRAQFFFEASANVASIQWIKDDVPLSGETGSTLVIPSASVADESDYKVELTNTAGTVTSGAASLTINDAATSKLANLSNRGFVGTGGDIMIPGLVISGTTARTFLVRGAGPRLEQFGVPGFLADPELALFRLILPPGEAPQSQLLVTNDDWETGNDVQEITDAMTNFAGNVFDTGSKDAALLVTLNPGLYTFQLSGVNDATGVGLIELFALD